MTATTQAPSRADLSRARLSGGRIIRSEWVKLVTLRSTWWCLGVLAALTAGLPAFIAFIIGEPWGGQPASVDIGYSNWMNATVVPMGFTVLVAAVLGCLVITGEYGTGMIRSTMTAAPKRFPAYLAKALVIGLAVFVTSIVALTVGAVLSGLIFSGNGYQIEPGEARVWWTIIAAAGYPALIAVFSVGVGTMLRNSAGSIAAVLGLLLVVPTIVQLFGALTGEDWVFDVGNFLPSSLGSVMSTPVVDGDFVMMQGTITLEPLQAVLAMLAWVVAALIGGAALLKSRDV